MIFGGKSKQEVKKWIPGSNGGSGRWQTVSKDEKAIVISRRDICIHDFSKPVHCDVEAVSASPSPALADLLQVQAELRDQFGKDDVPATLSDAVAKLQEESPSWKDMLLAKRNEDAKNKIYLKDRYLYTIKKADGACIPALGCINGTVTTDKFDQNLGYVLISADTKKNLMWGLYHDGATWKTVSRENIQNYE